MSLIEKKIVFETEEQQQAYIKNSKHSVQFCHFDNIIFTNENVEYIKNKLITDVHCNCLKCIFRYILICRTDIFEYHNYFDFSVYFQIIYNLIKDYNLPRYTDLIHKSIMEIFTHHKLNINKFIKQLTVKQSELYQFKKNDFVYIKDIQQIKEINYKTGKIIKPLNNYRYEIELLDKNLKNISISISNLELIEDETELTECYICFNPIESIYICPQCSQMCCYDCYIKINTTCDVCFKCRHEWKINYSEKVLNLRKKIEMFSDFVKVFD